MCLTPDQPQTWQIYSTEGTVPSLCAGEKRWGKLSPIIYAIQTKISYDLNRDVSPCVISSNYKEPIAVLELTRE